MIEFPPQISQEEYLKVLLTDPLEKLKAIIEKNNDKNTKRLLKAYRVKNYGAT